MLTEEKKQEILQEEKFRLQVQQELKTGKKNENDKVWEFLNSNFGIWLLSSVIVGIVTWGYTQATNKMEQLKKYETVIRKYDVEISSRIKDYKSAVLHLKQNGDYYNSNNILLISGHYTFPEFQNLPLRTILLEQLVLVHNDRELEVKKAIEALDKIASLAKNSPIGVDREVWQGPIDKSLVKNSKEIISILDENFSNKYWN